MVIGGNRDFDDCRGAGFEATSDQRKRPHTQRRGRRRQEVLSCEFAKQARGATDAEMGQTSTKMREDTDQLREGNAKEREKAAKTLLELLYKENIENFNAAGGLVSLGEVTRSGNGALKAEAAMALLNLALNSENKEKISDAGGILALIALVRDGNDVQKENAGGALWNLAYENSRSQNAIISEAGAVDLIFRLALKGTPTQQECASGVLGFLAQHLDADTKLTVATKGGMEALLRWIMRPENSKWVHEGLVALLGLCVDGDDIVRSSVENVGGCEILAKLIQSDDERIKSLAGQLSAWLSGDLCQIANLCSKMNEAEPLCRHVLERLQSLLDGGIYIVGAIKARTQAYLMSSIDKPRLLRLVGARSLADGLADLHHEIDRSD